MPCKTDRVLDKMAATPDKDEEFEDSTIEINSPSVESTDAG